MQPTPHPIEQPTSKGLVPRQHWFYDFKNEAVPEQGELFQKCIAIALGFSICFDIDPEKLQGAASLQYAGVSLAKVQYQVGEPVSIGFGVDGIGKGQLTVALVNSDSHHQLKFHLVITGPFGIQVLDKCVTVELPF